MSFPGTRDSVGMKAIGEGRPVGKGESFTIQRLNPRAERL